MTSLLRLTCLTIGIVLLKGISCGSFKKPQNPKVTLSSIDPDLLPLPALPEIPYLPWSTPLPSLAPYTKPLTPIKLKPCCPENITEGNHENLIQFPENPGISTKIQATTEPIASAVTNGSILETPLSVISTTSPGTSTVETPDSSTRLSAATHVPEISTTLSPATKPLDISTAFTSESSATATESPEASSTSFSETEAPNTPSTSFPATGLPENLTTSIPDLEALETSTRVPIEDETTGSVVDPTKPCPNNQSLISERDLETITKYKIDNLNLAELLNESFYVTTAYIKDNIKEEIRQFLIWFEDRPAHMKHILEDLTSLRTKVEKKVQQQYDKLEEYKVLENEYDAKKERLQKLTKRIENYKNLCKLNCEDDDSITFSIDPYVLRSNDRSFSSNEIARPLKTIDATKYIGGGKYYCSNIDALVHRIKKILLNKLNATKDSFEHKIITDSKMYAEKVKNLKIKLKSIALSQFGASMYDILNLQDEYHHFDELLKTDVHRYTVRIKRQFARFESMTMDLEVRAERLRKYCISCSMPTYTYVRHSFHVGNSATKDLTEETDLVDYITNKMYDNVSEQAFADYHNIFSELEPVFQELESNDEKIANLEPIQAEVARMIAQETEELNKLKEGFSKKSITSVIELEHKAKELNENVNKMEKELTDNNNY